MDEFKQWRRLSRVLFRRSEPPGRMETEAFVRRVMERLPEEEPASRWFVPALAFSFAVLALSFIPAGQDPFLQDTQETEISEWVSLQEPGLPIMEEE